ncbi:DUF2892 domain-containing protein [Paenibacillus ehimensis]
MQDWRCFRFFSCWKGEIKYLGLIGIPLLYTALTRKCLINRLLGINSCKL